MSQNGHTDNNNVIVRVTNFQLQQISVYWRPWGQIPVLYSSKFNDSAKVMNICRCHSQLSSQFIIDHGGV